MSTDVIIRASFKWNDVFRQHTKVFDVRCVVHSRKLEGEILKCTFCPPVKTITDFPWKMGSRMPLMYDSNGEWCLSYSLTHKDWRDYSLISSHLQEKARHNYLSFPQQLFAGDGWSIISCAKLKIQWIPNDIFFCFSFLSWQKLKCHTTVIHSNWSWPFFLPFSPWEEVFASFPRFFLILISLHTLRRAMQHFKITPI